MCRIPRIRPTDVLPPWRVLTQTIGQRVAGTEAEHTAACYLLDEFRAAGLADPRREPFPCTSPRAARAVFQVREGTAWRAVASQVLCGSPSLESSRRLVEMPLVWVEMPEQAAALRPGAMRGKAVAIFGPLATNPAHHRALVKSGASLVVWIDDRLPFPWAKADGILPAWARRHGVLPTIAISYRDAYECRLRNISRVRAAVASERDEAVSCNVVGDLPGQEPALPALVFGCHYDTQPGSVGADDNASGVVAVIALARAFVAAARQKPFARAIRFIAFGTEEQLSVGSRAYCLGHRDQMKRHALMVNFDCISSALGHTEMIVAGPVRMGAWFQTRLAINGLRVRVCRQVNPFSDHFPFSAFGVPAVWFCRPNFPGGRWQHHSIHDTLDNCSAEALCAIVNALSPLAARLATGRRLPFSSSFPPDQRATIRKYAAELYDLPA